MSNAFSIRPDLDLPFQGKFWDDKVEVRSMDLGGAAEEEQDFSLRKRCKCAAACMLIA